MLGDGQAVMPTSTSECAECDAKAHQLQNDTENVRFCDIFPGVEQEVDVLSRTKWCRHLQCCMIT